jgi:transcriptional regulator with XRE-family HTH domain
MTRISVGATLRTARTALGLTQRELAGRTEVSERLVREVELDLRPNVSFDTIVRLFAHVGLSMRLDGPTGTSVTVRSDGTDDAGQRARAEIRRRTWSGRQLTGLDAQNAEPSATPGAQGIAAVSAVSESAGALARAKPQRVAGRRSSNRAR